MKVKVVFYVKRKLFAIHDSIEEVFDETILDMGDFGVIIWDKDPMFRRHFWSLESYLKRFEHMVANTEEDIEIVELGGI